MWHYFLNKVYMHGYGVFVWGAVFFSVTCLLSYFIHTHFLFKKTIKRIRINIEMGYD